MKESSPAVKTFSAYKSVIRKKRVMKTIVTTFLLALLAFSVEAQSYIGGGIGFWYNDKENRTTITFTPEIGYRVSRRFAFGARIGYEHNKDKDTRNDTYTLAPYLKHYLYSYKDLDLLWDGTVEYSYIDSRKDGGGNCIGVGVKPGISYTINSHFCITAHFGFIGYRHCDNNIINAGNDAGLGFKFHNELHFSFHYHF